MAYAARGDERDSGKFMPLLTRHYGFLESIEALCYSFGYILMFPGTVLCLKSPIQNDLFCSMPSNE